MPLTRIIKLAVLLVLMPIALAYGILGQNGRVELAVLGIGAVIFFIAHSIENRRGSA